MGNFLQKSVFTFTANILKILAFGFFLIFVTDNYVSGQILAEEIVDLEFEYPDNINAGESFTFTVIMKKADNYTTPGSIRCTFNGGMTPGYSQMSGADFSIENSTATILWNKISKSNIIHFPVSVKTTKDQGGVYPVRVNYADGNGLQLHKNIGVLITGKDKPARPLQPIVESPFTVKLVYPEEVYFDEEYYMDIVIAKGKNTGGAKVFLQVPPQSELAVLDFPDYNYKQEPGDLCIRLNTMPASPEFKIRCKIKNTSEIKSVYPVRVSVEILDGKNLSFNDFILVTDTKTISRSTKWKNAQRSVNAAVNADTGSLFEELDYLLNTWTKSTGKLKNSIPELQKETPPNSNEKEEINSILFEDVVFYSIQIAASQIELTSLESQLEEKGIREKILEDYDGRIYRYSVGVFETIKEALELREKLISKGYPDAFIVEYVNGVRERSFY